eukprot:SAG31_NODE_19_length_35031_cov_42.510707_3_plen_168_part_00
MCHPVPDGHQALWPYRGKVCALGPPNPEWLRRDPANIPSDPKLFGICACAAEPRTAARSSRGSSGQTVIILVGDREMLCHRAPWLLLALLLRLGGSSHALWHASSDTVRADRPAPAARRGVVWADARALVSNSGWNASVARAPYARLPAAAEKGEWCSPPCPVRGAL